MTKEVVKQDLESKAAELEYICWDHGEEHNEGRPAAIRVVFDGGVSVHEKKGEKYKVPRRAVLIMFLQGRFEAGATW